MECGVRAHYQKKKRMVATPRHGVGKRWAVVYIDPATGKERSESFERHPEADDRCNALNADIPRGDYIDPNLGRKAFDELAKEYLELQVVGASTMRNMTTMVNALTRHFGKTPIGEILHSHVLSWRKKRSREVKASTVNLELWILRSVMEMAVNDDRIRKNPTAKVKQLKEDPYQVEPWSLETIQKIIESHACATCARPDAPAHACTGRLQIVPALSFGAGLRQGESFGVGIELGEDEDGDRVESDDIDWLRKRLHVRRQIIDLNGKLYFTPPKKNSTGHVDLDKETVEWLAAHVKRYPPVEVTLEWLEYGQDPTEPGYTPELLTVKLYAVSVRGKALRGGGGYNESHWWPALEAAKIKRAGRKTGQHHLRHDFASYSIYEGENLLYVQKQMRHRNLNELTTTYAHVIQSAESKHLEAPVAGVFKQLRQAAA